jgi:hypothetical protein
VAAVGPLDIKGSKRGGQVSVAAGLIGLLILGHALRAVSATRRT